MLATILYLATIVLCLYVPRWFPPGYEGADSRVIFPLVVASATQAALQPGAALGRRWANTLAACWMVGAVVSTPHLFFPPSTAQVIVNGIAATCAGGLVVVVGIWRLLFNRALSMTGRLLRAAGLVMVGAPIVMVGIWPLLRGPRAALLLFEVAVLGGAGLTIVGAVADAVVRDAGSPSTGKAQ